MMRMHFVLRPESRQFHPPLRLFVLHKCLPHKARAMVLRYQHGDPKSIPSFQAAALPEFSDQRRTAYNSCLQPRSSVWKEARMTTTHHPRPQVAAEIPAVPLTTEGYSVLHQMMRLHWPAWRALTASEKSGITKEASDALAVMAVAGLDPGGQTRRSAQHGAAMDGRN